MSQTDAQKRAMKKYLSNPENRKKKTTNNAEYVRRKKHEKNIEHAKNIIALGNNVDAVTEYIENILKHRKARSAVPNKITENESGASEQHFIDDNLEVFVNPITEEIATYNPKQSINRLSSDLFSENDISRKIITPVVQIGDAPKMRSLKIDDTPDVLTTPKNNIKENSSGFLTKLVERVSLMPKEELLHLDKWKDNGKNGAHLLTMPNIPTPLQGPGMQPRTILGSTNWDSIRKKCYADAKYHCQICGKSCIDSQLQCHEVFSIDYEKRTSTFERVVAVCPLCHTIGIHSGRALTLYKKRSSYTNKEHLLKGVENAFHVTSLHNKTHPSSEPLRLFESFLDYTKQESIASEVIRLIKKYDIQFYRIDERSWKRKYWRDWKLVIDGIEYPTIYKTREDWENAMKEVNKVWMVDP